MKIFLPGDRPELSKCMMPLLINYQSKIAGHGLELKRAAERYPKRKGPLNCLETAINVISDYQSI